MIEYTTKNENKNKIQDSVEFEQVIERGCGLARCA